MSDNPLADWLRERHAALGEAGATPDDAATGMPPAWPDWATPATTTPDPAPEPWEHPPGGGDAPPRRRRRLVLLATVPWLVAAAIVVGALGDSTAGSRPPPQAGAGAGTVEAGPAVAGQSVDPRLGAAAAVAVRLSVTTPADTPDGDAERRYVDSAAPEAVRWSGDVAIVTVLAVVLEGPADAWRMARTARFAVPVGLVDGQAVVLGEPWAVSPPPESAPVAGWAPAAGDRGAIAGAAEAAGYADVEVLEVEALPDDTSVLRARIRARAPGESTARVHAPWLHADPDPAVLGAGD